MLNPKFEDGPVLLVCVYNRFGNIITHDFLYQLFTPFGQIVKILIFQKAKVWKTFIEFQNKRSAPQALKSLNNKIIFEDGSKMNIFHSKLKHVQFQNDNLGGVNYQRLKYSQQQEEQQPYCHSIRKRNSTFQDHYSNVNQYHPFQHSTQSFIQIDNNSSQTYKQSLNSFKSYEQKIYNTNLIENSDSTFYQSEKINSKKSFGGGSFNDLMDVDDLFREIALESHEYRQYEQAQNRKKSKTIFNPLSQQFLIENCPSRVIFIRSVPETYTHQCLYNIFINFGTIKRMIFMKDKCSALMEFEQVYEAIRAKDEINYIKCHLKIFYSHYESLVLRKQCQDELSLQYKSSQVMSKSCLSKKKAFNPPSQTLYLTMMCPNLQQQLLQKCFSLQIKPSSVQWKQNSKDKWMCLVQFITINDSLLIIGMLQDQLMSNGKRLKISFTRSKIIKQKGIFEIPEENQLYDDYLV